MARRWAWRIGAGLLLLVLLSFGTWRLLQNIPGLVAKAEDAIREETEALGFRISYRDLRFHLLHFRVSLDDLNVLDGIAGVPLASAEHVDVSISPWRILSGGSPVSRILVRKFSVRAGEINRPLAERLRTSGEGGEGGVIPEVILVDGDVHIGPLGSLVRWDANLPMVRVRPTRFRGTRVTAEIVRAAGEVSLPEGGKGEIPFDRADIEFFLKDEVVRIRRFDASGNSVKLTLSGKWDGKERAVDVRLFGQADIAEWMAAGAPGGELIRPVTTAGTVSFSGRLEGTLERPEGSGKILARNLLFPANTSADLETSITVKGTRVRLEAIRGKVFDGVVSGAGSYDWETGTGDARISLERAVFGEAPWDSWGVPWHPAGRGEMALSLSGGKEAVEATVSLKNPGGFERPANAEGGAAKVTILISVTATGLIAPGREVLVRNLRAAVGGAEATGEGTYILEGGRIAFRGAIHVPRGRAEEYGWVYPVAWKDISCQWAVSGTAGDLHVTAGVRADDLAARALPPVPLSVKIEGNPGDVFYFVADIPSDVAKITATGTLTGPLSSTPPLLVSAVDVRDIDFSLARKWGGAVLSSLGKDPEPFEKYLSGMAGKGTADLQLSAGAGRFSISGTAHSSELRLSRIIVRTVSASGNWDTSPLEPRWAFRGSGETGGGKFLLEGMGEGAESRFKGTIEGIDLETVSSFADRESATGIRGRASVQVEAGKGPNGWIIDSFSASIPRLAAGEMTLEGVSAEGSLGGTSGELSLLSASPEVRLLATVRREKKWPVSFSVRTSGVPTEIFLKAIGEETSPAGGSWDLDAEGVVLGKEIVDGKGVQTGALTAFRFSLAASSPSFSGVSFEGVHAEGKMEGDILIGRIGTRLPDSDLSYSLALRDPYGFRLEGPFSMERQTGTSAEEEFPSAPGETPSSEEGGEARLSIAGGIEITGSLLALEDTRGTLRVKRILYRTGGVDMTGEDVLAEFSREGVRWAEGSLLAAGNPLHVAGKASWAGDLDLRLGGTVPAETIRLATDVFDRLEGIIRVNVRVTGKWDDPSVIGTGHLENATFSFEEYGQLFEKMNVDAVISRDKIIFEHIEGRSGGGYIDGSGELPLQFDKGQRMFFSVDFFDMRYPYPADLHPVIQGHVELIGPPVDVLVTGDVEIQSATYTKPVRPAEALLDFRRRVADVTARREDTGFRMRLDLEAIADGTIRVRNNIAEAVISGDFKLVGDTNNVIILGTFDITEGNIDYQGGRYDLTRATLDFQDPRRINPRLDIQAETKRGSVSVIVNVTGTLAKYHVELSSDPPYSKNDIVSLLTLGRTTESAGPAEGQGSGTGAAAIGMGVVTGGVTEEIGSVVGLDKFAIEPSFSTRENTFEPRFVVGKSFGDRFSVELATTVGGTSNRSSATAEYQLLKNIYLSGTYQGPTFTQESDIGADVKFRYRYRQFQDIFRDND